MGNETKFTPGPWEPDEAHNNLFRRAGGDYEKHGQHWRYLSNGHHFVADVVTERSPRGDAIFSLITAAPELYAALERMLNVQMPDDPQTPHCNEISIQARLALKKARGE